MPFRINRVTIALVGSALTLLACRSGAPASGDSTSTPSPTPGANATASSTVKSDSVLLRTDKTQYRAGEKVTLTFENKSGSRYTFNPCTRALERERAGSWVAVPDPGRMCTMEAWVLDAHGTRTGDTELDSPLEPGRYRVVVRMSPDTPNATSSINAVSDPIAVS
jgi:hypothetical protein